MKNIRKIEKQGTNTTWYEITNKNKKGESIQIEITECYPNNESTSSLPNLWKKVGFTEKLYKNYLCCDTYVTDKDGNCWTRYNPTTKLSEDKSHPSYIVYVETINEIYRKFMEVE